MRGRHLPKLWVGLGNPGKQFDGHRHNLGKAFLVTFAAQHQLNWRTSNRLSAQIACLDSAPHGDRIQLGLPLEYMNNSGISVAKLLDYFRFQPSDLLVIHDELDLPLATIRLKFSGGLAGHNGLKSISHALGSKDFWRLRIGIGRPNSALTPIVQHVLQAPEASEIDQLQQVLPSCHEALLHWLRSDQLPKTFCWSPSTASCKQR